MRVPDSRQEAHRAFRLVPLIVAAALFACTAPRPAASPGGPQPVEVKVNPKDGQRYVRIPPGSFRMGCSPGDGQCVADEEPAHSVTQTKSFWMGQTEVTVGAYQRFAQATGRAMPPEPKFEGRSLNPGWKDELQPMTMVSWEDAAAYCSWAGGRLPTEAEWEYAARAGTAGPRYGELDAIAWYADNSGKAQIDAQRIWEQEAATYVERRRQNANRPRGVGQKRPNGWGLYDMLGNVWEWVADWYGKDYYGASKSPDPQGPPGGEYRALRGGSWDGFAWVVRASVRFGSRPGVRGDRDFGFRCAREVIP